MATILISRGTMAGGQEVAECLKKRGGLRCLTREDLVSAINAHGEAAAKVVAALPRAVRAYQEFSGLRRPYKILMRLAMLEFFREGNSAATLSVTKEEEFSDVQTGVLADVLN
ncbi:MAG: hypothetical protein JHC34_06610 [Acidobacteria bacterium]|nr:hypothetical protein [Acidobacteriota bacterium]